MRTVASASPPCDHRPTNLVSAVLAALVAACGAAPGDGTTASTSSAISSSPTNPEIVGGANGDYAAQVPAGSLISSVVGSFPSVTGVVSEVDSNANNYMLQINSNQFVTPLCSRNGAPIAGCAGWQQYFYSPAVTNVNGTPVQNGRIFIEYWVLGYGTTCPTSAWVYEGNNNCKLDSPKTTVPAQPITNLANLQLTATAGSQDGLSMSIGGVVYTLPAQPSVLGLSNGWRQAEFNVLGNLDGSEAIFNGGSTIVVQALVTSVPATTAAPLCAPIAVTAEQSNLYLDTISCSAFGGATPGIRFVETNVTCSSGQVYDSSGACVFVGSPCGGTASDVINSVGQCVPVGSACGTTAGNVVSTRGLCVTMGSSCTSNGGPPGDYVYETTGACVLVGSACGASAGYVVTPAGQCTGVGSACGSTPGSVLSDQGDCVTPGTGCAMNGDAPGVWSATGQCVPQTITCPPGEVVGGPPGGEYCYAAGSGSSSGFSGGSGGGSGGSGNSGGSSGGGCPKCVNKM